MGKKHNINSTVFDNIDTAEKAYWLGFIYADGNISNHDYIYEKTGKHIYRIEISLQENDIDHLNKLKIFLNFNGNITINKVTNRLNRCRLYFNDKHMWNTLNNHGCTPNKSLTLEFPTKAFKEYNNLYIRHFIRGYVDGDGCISYGNKNHNKMVLSILGTENVLSGIQDNLPLESKNKLRKIKNIHCLTFNNKRGLYVCKYLYEFSTVHLERKFQRYKEYCRLYEGS